MTPEEKQIMDKIIEAHNLYSSLDQTHPSDALEWQRAIHDLQKLIGMRILRRDHPEIFPTYK